MPKPRRAENIGLPERWQFNHGAYFYRVPPGHERHWGYKKRYRLGKTIDAALKTFLKVGSRLAPDESPHDLLEPESLIATSLPVAKQGVYFLISAGTIVYVGRSDSVQSRIASHVHGKKIEFDSYSFLPAVGYQQERLEQLYITAFRPRHNINIGGKSPQSMTPSA